MKVELKNLLKREHFAWSVLSVESPRETVEGIEPEDVILFKYLNIL